MIIYTISSIAFLMLDSESVAERGDAFYQISTQIASISQVIIYCREVRKSRRMIRKFELFFAESELRMTLLNAIDIKIKIQNFSKFDIFLFFVTEKELNDPETAVTFIELHEKIDRLCNLTIFSLVKVTTTMFNVPTFIGTISNYFMLNLGDESFLLPSPISYVL